MSQANVFLVPFEKEYKELDFSSTTYLASSGHFVSSEQSSKKLRSQASLIERTIFHKGDTFFCLSQFSKQALTLPIQTYVVFLQLAHDCDGAGFPYSEWNNLEAKTNTSASNRHQERLIQCGSITLNLDEVILEKNTVLVDSNKLCRWLPYICCNSLFSYKRDKLKKINMEATFNCIILYFSILL